MIDPPKTLEEARKKIYGEWAGRPNGVPYRETQCAYDCWGGGWYSYQCSRNPGHGPAKLYCKQHAKMVGETP